MWRMLLLVGAVALAEEETPADADEPASAASADGRITVPIEDVVVKRLPRFRFPADPSVRKRGETPCKIRLLVDAEGRVERVDAVDCPAPFHAEIAGRADKIRIEPIVRGGRSVPFSTELMVRFWL